MNMIISFICRGYLLYHRTTNAQLTNCILFKKPQLIHINKVSVCISNKSKITCPQLSVGKKCWLKQNNQKCCYSTITTNNHIIKENTLEEKISKTIELIKNDVRSLKRISERDVNNLHGLLQLSGSCSEEQGIFLIQSCGKLLLGLNSEKRCALILSVWKTVKQLTSQIASDHYHALLTILAENKYAISVKDILSEMEQDGVLLNELCCHSLLRCVCEIGDIDQANKLIDLMSDFKIQRSQQVLDYLLLGHGRARNLQAVEEFITNNDGKLSASVLLKVYAETRQSDKFKLCVTEATLTEEERLDIIISLAVGNLIELIPNVIHQVNWTEEGIIKAHNTCIELIHLGYPEAGFILLTVLEKNGSHDKNILPSFIIQLIKSKTEMNKLIEIFTTMEKINPANLLTATRCALKMHQKDLSTELLKLMKSKGHPIRPHYFWPLIISESKIHGKQGILKIIELMVEMDVSLDFDTLRDYVLPRISFSNMSDLVKELRSHGVELVDAMTPCVYLLLINDQIKEAVELCSTYKSRMDWKLLTQALAQNFIRTGNASAIVSFLTLAPKSTANMLVQNVKILLKPFQVQNLDLLVQALEDKGLITPANQHNTVNNVLVNNKTSIPHPQNMTLEELECHLLELKGKKLNTRGVLRKLLQLHCRFGNVERTNEIKDELFSAGCTLSSGMMASLFQLYTANEKEDEAEKCLRSIENLYPDFKLDSYKLIDFATLLVNKNQYSKAVSFIESYKGDGSNMERNCKSLISTVAKVKGLDEAKYVLKTLIDRKYTKLSSELLSPLINFHLKSNNLKDAVQEFENCVKLSKKTPMLYRLLCALCTQKDKDLLDRVFNLGKKHHGSVNANVMYVMALAESNELSQLVEIVQMPQFHLDTDKLVVKCQHFVDTNNAQALENIMRALVKVPSINVEPICFLILQICIKQENCDAALELRTIMQEFKIIPSEIFSKKFKSLLQSCNRT